MVTTIRMACRGTRGDVSARCRHMVDGAGKCAQHTGAPDAPPPTVILMRVRANPNWIRRLEQDGVGWGQRNDAALDEKHRAEAERLGRSADTYREKADSGTPIFDQDGQNRLLNVSLKGLWDELEAQGYRFNNAHLYRRSHDDQQGSATLSLQFEFQGDVGDLPQTDTIVDLLENATWKEAYVWANPRKEDQSIPHTINVKYREPVLPADHRLVFDEGHWNIL